MNHSLKPLSLRQLWQSSSFSPDAPLQIDGKELTQILVVGRVNKVSVTSNAIIYSLDDGSACMDVKKFMSDDENDQGEQEPIHAQEGGMFSCCRFVLLFERSDLFAQNLTCDLCHHTHTLNSLSLSLSKIYAHYLNSLFRIYQSMGTIEIIQQQKECRCNKDQGKCVMVMVMVFHTL